MSEADDPNATCWSITLIHGTWGRGFFPGGPTKKPRWFEEGSAFRAMLESELKNRGFRYKISEFSWSGSNSIIERDQAARELAGNLSHRAEGAITQRSLLIGHSHGGNIALRALKLLGEQRAPAWVATMATPFLQIKAIPGGQASRLYEWMSFGLVALALSVMYLNVDSISRMTGLAFPLVPSSASSLVQMLAAILVGLLFALLMIFGRWIFQSAFEFDKQTGRAEALAAASLVDLNIRDKILVLRGADDEAATTLTFGGFGIYLVHLLIDRTIGRVLFLAVLVPQVFYLFKDVARLQALIPIPLTIIHLTWVILAWLLAAYLVALIGAQLLRSLFGRELLFRSAQCEVIAHSTPDFRSGVEVITLSEEHTDAMRHALYQQTRCAPEIAAWLARQEH